MNNNIPSPPTAQPGKLPQRGQYVTYREQDGTLHPGFVIGVGERSPDGKYCNVSAAYLLSNVEVQGQWLYEVSSGQIVWIPSGPPWPGGDQGN